MLRVKHELVKDKDGRIIYRVYTPGGRRHYNIRLFITGEPPEGLTITRVQYQLHPTFKKQIREGNSAKEWEEYIWTWGMFTLTAKIEFSDGSAKEIRYRLEYDLPKDDGENYVQQ
ncbi:MAG: pYEATS domain-containing protein [Candidatus Thorarchaeota archaeon]